MTSGAGNPPTRSYLRVCLPPESDLAAPAALKSFARKLLRGFPLLAGHCGWSYYTGGGFSDAEEVIDRDLPGWLLRYPGVSVGAPLGQANLMLDGLLATSWLTFVSEAAAKARGQDLADLAKSAAARGLGSEIVEPGVLEIQAGPAPETGDVNRQDLLPAYRQVGEVLAPLAMPDERAKFQTIADMDFESRIVWYRRFFGAA
ncbi:type VI immunity family protein [Roseateles chitinivorans]|uniref:type VI immunity family protein n=1 Tax=Roseateles chitinivorans TaxID=2917965 RepID=UPI003D6643BC